MTKKIKKIKYVLILVGLILLSFTLGVNITAVRGLFSKIPTPINQIISGNTVSAKQLVKLLKNKNFTLINVHVPYEGEIPQTDIFVPYDQVVFYSSNLPKDKNTPIILYCQSGRMSAEAMLTFKKMGFTNVKHLSGGMNSWVEDKNQLLNLSSLEKDVIPAAGIELPVSWSNLGPQLVKLGIIDLSKFKQAVKLSPAEEKILTEGSEDKIWITAQNSQFVVDLLWAVGLAQKSLVYDQGPMGQEYKDRVGNFASTGGWTLAIGNATNYLNKYDLVKLTIAQQKQIAEISKNVYRPCCGNSTWFPDCNHGMAALAAIELMVAAGVNESEIYRNILALNSYWFSGTYLSIATHFARQGISWGAVDAKTVLSRDYSSGQGAASIARKVGPLPYKPQTGGAGCGA